MRKVVSFYFSDRIKKLVDGMSRTVLFDNKHKTIHDIFGNLPDASLYACVNYAYRKNVEPKTHDWFCQPTLGGPEEQAFVPDECNKRLMWSNVLAFAQTIAKHTLVPGMGGEVWSRLPKTEPGPKRLLSAKHRALAFYKINQDDPKNTNVMKTREQGLSNCFDYDAFMPDAAAVWMTDYSNRWHHNGNTNWLQKMENSVANRYVWDSQLIRSTKASFMFKIVDQDPVVHLITCCF
jgi:hypothetical protein